MENIATIRIEFGGGMVKDVLAEAIRVATLLSLVCRFEMNDIDCRVFPDTDLEVAIKLYQKAVTNKEVSVFIFSR